MDLLNTSLRAPATPLTLVEGLKGGALIGGSAALFLLLSGQRAGLSGIFSGFMRPFYKPWKSAFAAGFLGAVLAASQLYPSSLSQVSGPQLGWEANVLGGLLVGFGTRLGNGCTSGHGVCGLARLSKRGLVAVLTFMGVGVLTATLLNNRGAFLQPAGKWDLALSLSSEHSQHWARALAAMVLLLALWDPKGKAAEGWALSLASLVCGAIFAVGLIVGQMCVRQKVINFLWLGPSWDPSLMAVMGAWVAGAVLVNLGPTQYLLNRPSVALCDSKARIGTAGVSAWQLSKAEVVDWKLVTGAAVFGVGWGVAGLCPGPAWVAVAAGYPKVLLGFLPAMLTGNLLHLYLIEGGGGLKKKA